MAAQVAHAALSGYKRAKKATPEQSKQWSALGQGKVVLKVPTGEELLEVQKAAKAEGLNTYLVMDAGKTQIASGTRTVLCIGPGRYSCLFSQLRTV
jgi:PTH2 family peptidyl-tRNA hydrolase